jgi:hypothetical protein
VFCGVPPSELNRFTAAPVVQSVKLALVPAFAGIDTLIKIELLEVQPFAAVPTTLYVVDIGGLAKTEKPTVPVGFHR